MKNSSAIFVLISTLLCSSVFAQSTEDIVYLKNGSILHGTILHSEISKSVSIEITGQNLIVIPDSLVLKTEINVPVNGIPGARNETGFVMECRASFYGGQANSLGFCFTPAYTINSWFTAGLGTGIEWFERQQVPLFADFKFNVLQKKFCPYLYCQTGYAFPLTREENIDYYSNSQIKGGFLVGTGAGLKVHFYNHNAISFSVGYRFQQTKSTWSSGPWIGYDNYQYVHYDKYNRISFSMSFLID